MSSIVKSFSVGNGDMFYIKHASDNFTVIDSYLKDDNKERIIAEILEAKKYKSISRFISTHPDEDHIKGLKYFNDKVGIENFYCVDNEATKTVNTEDFEEYCNLRDSDKSYKIYKNCKRKWMNDSDDTRGSSGIHIPWPNISDKDAANALQAARQAVSGIPEANMNLEKRKDELNNRKTSCANNPSELEKFDAAAKLQNYDNFNKFRADSKVTKEKVDAIEQLLRSVNCN